MIDALLPDALSPGWALALTALSFFTSALSASLGLGGGVALITVLLQVLPPAVVLPLHGVVQAGSNAGRAYAMRESVDRTILKWFSAGSVVGITLAMFAFANLPAAALKLALATFILWSLWAPKPRALLIDDRGFFAVGGVATFLTLFLGVTGPLVAAFWNVAKLGRQGVVATHGAVMTVQHSLKVIAFGLLGFAFGEWLLLIGAMLLSGHLGTLAGKVILGRLPERVFAIAFRGILTLLALRLAADGYADL